jgi:hypothetical protein
MMGAAVVTMADSARAYLRKRAAAVQEENAGAGVTHRETVEV